MAYSHSQRIEQIAGRNGMTNAGFVCFGSCDQTKCVHCAKLAPLIGLTVADCVCFRSHDRLFKNLLKFQQIFEKPMVNLTKLGSADCILLAYFKKQKVRA